MLVREYTSWRIEVYVDIINFANRHEDIDCIIEGLNDYEIKMYTSRIKKILKIVNDEKKFEVFKTFIKFFDEDLNFDINTPDARYRLNIILNQALSRFLSVRSYQRDSAVTASV